MTWLTTFVLVHAFLQVNVEFEKTLQFDVSTPAVAWPSIEDRDRFINWIDLEITSCRGQRHAILLATRGYYLYFNNEKAVGIENLKSAIAEAPDDLRIFCMCIAVGKIDTSSLPVVGSLRIEPWRSEYHLAQLLSRKRDLKNTEVEELITTSADSSSARLLRGWRLLLGGKYKEAKLLMREYVMSTASGPLGYPELPHLLLAMSLRELGEFESARETMLRGLEFNPISSSGLLEIVLVDCALGKETEALDIAKLMSKLYDGDYKSDYALAHALYHNGEYRKAIVYYKRLIAADKSNHHFALRAAECMLRCKDVRNSAATLRNFVVRNPTHSHVETFCFKVAVYELQIPDYAGHDREQLVLTICTGIVKKLGVRSDRLLGLGSLVNQKQYKLAERYLKIINTDGHAAEYQRLEDAVHSALIKKEVFRL